MNFYESLIQALESLKGNKLRTFLTMFGIIMGVLSVITIVALGNAVESFINSEFEKLGANLLEIRLNTRSLNEKDWIKLDDIKTINKVAPEIKNINPKIQQSGELRINSKSRQAIVVGTGEQIKYMGNIDMAFGRLINEIDISQNRKVVVIDDFFARRYYRKTNAVGEKLSLKTSNGNTVTLKIIGVRSTNDVFLSSMMDNEDFPASIIIPITTVMEIYNLKKIDSIQVTIPGEQDKVKEIGNKIIKALEFKHRNTSKYSVTNSADIQKSLSESLGVLSLVLLIIAFITLLVGGIGIINILLVSVTERIREIGIRKALGAEEKDIVLQFLTESVIITATSGLIGIALGLIIGNTISYLINIPPIINWFTVIGSFFGSILLGLIFGVYPAKKAAELDPIECLRHE